MTMREARTGAWVWANLVALLPELIFLVYGATGLFQTAAVLVVAWLILKPGSVPVTVSIVAGLSLASALHAGVMWQQLVDIGISENLPDRLMHALPLFAFRFITMAIALAPLAIMQVQAARRR
ncbi:MAG TPA: hypothetical protein VGO52_23045 [Hyphomonadaceae bacterium]|jgi:hypothetical protein|nr:hypothetical protein [Hyphomonadaceae bacterium]